MNPSKFSTILVSFSCVVIFGGCDSQETTTAQTNYHRDVKPVIDAYCAGCHQPGGIGPFALTTYKEVIAVSSLLGPSIQSRQMPPFIAAPAQRPLRFDRSLSDAQIDLVTSWLENGAPEGNADEPGEAITLEQPSSPRRDLVLEMPAAYTPTQTPDEYRCFVIDWPHTTTRYVTSFEFSPGNLEIDHHSAAYLIDPELVSVVEAADGEDGRPGYGCFGGATPGSAESSVPSKFIAAWVPGSGAVEFPAGSGLKIEPGSKIVLQMHYNTSTAAEGASDASSMAFELEPEVDQVGGHLPWLDVNWVGNPQSMLIRAGESQVVHEYVADPTQSPLLGEFAPGVNPTEGIYIHNTLPHLHKLGSSFELTLERSDGSSETLLRINQWDFDWQNFFQYAEPVLVLPGDQLRMRCEWDNSTTNQPSFGGMPTTPADAVWGEGTFDEMCVAALFVTGVTDEVNNCEGSIPAETGRFEITFDTTQRDNSSLDGEFMGPVSGSIFKAEDVTLLGPKDGAEPVASFDYASIDLRGGPDGPYLIDQKLPAGDYQFLGYMDIDDNADQFGGPDEHDPVIIPTRAVSLGCEVQRVTVQFPILRPPL